MAGAPWCAPNYAACRMSLQRVVSREVHLTLVRRSCGAGRRHGDRHVTQRCRHHRRATVSCAPLPRPAPARSVQHAARSMRRAGDMRHATCGAQCAARDIRALRSVLQLRDRRARRRAVACDRRGCALEGGAREIWHRARPHAATRVLHAAPLSARSPVSTSAQWPASLVSCTARYPARHGIPHGTLVLHPGPTRHNIPHGMVTNSAS